MSALQAGIYLKHQQKQANMFYFNHHTDDEYEQEIQAIDNNQYQLYQYQFSVLVHAQSESEVSANALVVSQLFRQFGYTPIVESRGMEWLWRSQFPACDEMVRVTHPNTAHLAQSLLFQKDPSGLMKSDWGAGPVRYFKTLQGSAYAFQFHIDASEDSLAHSLVVAPAGSGKTTLFQHLIGGAMTHPDLCAYIFDRFNGTQIFTESVGGTHIDFAGNIPLNPFLCEGTALNRDFLTGLLLMMSGSEDEQSVEVVGRAVELLLSVPPKDRVLSKLLDEVFDCNASVKQKFVQMLRGGQSVWFDGQRTSADGQSCAYDALDLNASRLITFEMTQVLAENEKAQLLAGPLVHYLMHRIRENVRAHALPHLVFIDETAPMLKNELFKNYVATLFREHRKLRGSINVCFQDASAISQSGISETLLNQCKTQIFFTNPQARKEDYKIFDMSEAEWDFIKGEHAVCRDLHRGVLVRKPTESVILDIDLAYLGPLLRIYRSGSQAVVQFNQMKTTKGETWLRDYLYSA